MQESPSKSRNWCFTLNNPVIISTIPESHPLEEEFHDPRVKYLVYQLEKGKDNTPHFQGYVEMIHAVSLAAMKKILPKAHWETRKGTSEQARSYCMKNDTKISGPYEQGVYDPPKQGKRNDLASWAKMIKEGKTNEELFDSAPNNYLKFRGKIDQVRADFAVRRSESPEVILHIGSTGVGKSHSANENSPDAYWAYDEKYFCGWNGQRDLVLDEFVGWIPLHTILRICDKYPLLLPVKGGNIAVGNIKKVQITTNILPELWKWKAQPSQYEAFYRRISKIVWHLNKEMKKEYTNFEEFQVEYKAFSEPSPDITTYQADQDMF